jgi:hypothetical protein
MNSSAAVILARPPLSTSPVIGLRTPVTSAGWAKPTPARCLSRRPAARSAFPVRCAGLPAPVQQARWAGGDRGRGAQARRRQLAPGSREMRTIDNGRRRSPRPGLAEADGDRRARTPQVELHELSRPIHRPLVRPRRRREQRPHLAQVRIEDGLMPGVPQRCDELGDANGRQLRLVPKEAMDLILERVELRAACVALVSRRIICAAPAGWSCDRAPCRAAAGGSRRPARSAACAHRPTVPRPARPSS